MIKLELNSSRSRRLNRALRTESGLPTETLAQDKKCANSVVIHTEPRKRPATPYILTPVPSKALRKATSHQTSPATPRPQSPRAPLTTLEAFKATYRAATAKLDRYFELDRKGSVRLDGETQIELDPGQAMYLPANNAWARMRYAQITAEQLDAAVGALAPDQPVFFVTLINGKHAVREDEAGRFSVRRVHSWVHHILRGYSFVGMVEGAYYTNVDVIGAGYRRAVSWHVHAIVWGISEPELATLIEAANRRYRSMIAGIAPAHYRTLTRSEVFGQALYMNKGQISEYRVWPRKRPVMDGESGEITIVGTGRFNQAKRDLRPGDMARMCIVFAGRRLDQLAFAGGTGKGVLSAIRYEADAARRRFEDRAAATQSLKAQQKAMRGQPHR